MRTLSLCAVIACLMATASAQEIEIDHEARFFSPWPEDQDLPQFERAVTGYLGDDPWLDSVVLRTMEGQTAAVYQPNVHRFNAAYPIGEQEARDVSILPGAAPGGRDAVLVLTSDGLELHRADTGQSLALVATETSAGWQNAQRVWVVRSVSGAPWILGLDSSGLQMLRTTWDGSDFIAQPSFPVVFPSDVQSFDYDGVGENELLIQSGSFAVVTTWDGSVIRMVDMDVSPSTPPPTPFRQSAVISHGHPGSNPIERDLVVLHVYWEVTNEYFAVVFNSDFGEQISLGEVAANHQAAADVDGDGLEDVLLSRSDRSELFVLRRINDTVSFTTTGGPNWMPLVVPENQADQGLDFSVPGDFDGDGDTDVLAFQSAFGHVHSFYGDVVSGRRPACDVPNNPGPFQPGELTWIVKRPDDWTSIVNDNVGGDLEIRIEGWAQVDSSTPFMSLRRIDQTVPALFSPSVDSQSISITYDGSDFDAGDYALQIHTSIARIDTDNGAIIKSYPSRLAYYTPNVLYAGGLRAQTHYETGTSNVGPQEGDGFVNGNRGMNAKPSAPE